LTCLHHLLLSLNFSDEFESLTALYEQEFRNVTDSKRHQLLMRPIWKAGLSYVHDKLVIADEQRSNSVSLWKRVDK
jgi:hypothetical protein